MKKGLKYGIVLLLVFVLFQTMVVTAFAAGESMFGGDKEITVNDDGYPYVLGTKFKVNVDGKITAIKNYAPVGDNGDHVAAIWDVEKAEIIAGPFTWNYTGADDWVVYELPEALSVKAGVEYLVSVTTGIDAFVYPAVVGEFATAGNNGKNLLWGIDAGVFDENVEVMPTKSWNSCNYLRDVVFVADDGSSGNPKTGDPGMIALIIMTVAAISVLAYVQYRRKFITE